MKLSSITVKNLLEFCGYTTEGIRAIKNGIEKQTAETDKIVQITNDFLNSNYRLLLLTGDTGVGKSYIIQRQCALHFIEHKKYVADDVHRVAYLRYCFHYDIRLDDLSSNSFKASKNPKETYNELCNTTLLIIDEFCEFNTSASDLAYIENVVKKRYGNDNKTILISNRTSKELSIGLGLSSAFLDRLFSTRFSKIANIEGKSLRSETDIQNSNS